MEKLSEEKWNDFKDELEFRVADLLREKYKLSPIKNKLVDKYKDNIFLNVLEEVELEGPEIVGKWIEKKWSDFNWDDESEEGKAEYYQAFIEALSDGEFDEIIDNELNGL